MCLRLIVVLLPGAKWRGLVLEAAVPRVGVVVRQVGPNVGVGLRADALVGEVFRHELLAIGIDRDGRRFLCAGGKC